MTDRNYATLLHQLHYSTEWKKIPVYYIVLFLSLGTMGIGVSNQTCIRWAAQDGRADDLVFHLSQVDPYVALKSISDDLKRYPIHLAAVGGHTRCVQILWEAGRQIF